jgi:outer membrane protein assembly factor BamD
MTYIVNSLARYEVAVARYYYTRGAYVAAANRAQTAVTDYPNVPATEEALYLMMVSYDQLKLTQLRDDAKRVLERNFPKSAYLSGGPQKKSGWLNLW